MSDPVEAARRLVMDLDACEPIMGEVTPGTGRVVLAWEVPEHLMLRVRDAIRSESAGTGLDVETFVRERLAAVQQELAPNPMGSYGPLTVASLNGQAEAYRRILARLSSSDTERPRA